MYIFLCTGGVLIHCAAGRSRSAAIAVAYIMRTERLSVEAALASVRCVQSTLLPPALKEGVSPVAMPTPC